MVDGMPLREQVNLIGVFIQLDRGVLLQFRAMGAGDGDKVCVC